MHVQLLGAAEALLARESYEVPGRPRARDIVRALASEDAALARQLMTDDGAPRTSARILVDGIPVLDYDVVIPAGAHVAVAPTLSCDG